jgi:hypothetical protein
VAYLLIFLSHDDGNGRATYGVIPIGHKRKGTGRSFMVTNYPQQLTATAHVTHDKAEHVVARTLSRLGQLFCGLRGHDSVLHFEGNRVNMRCTSCGHDTPGWEISGRGPRRRYEGDARRHLLATQRLVLRKSA